MITVLLTEAVAMRLLDASQAASPYETGGILLGLVTEGNPWITQSVELPQAVPARNRYRIPRGATQAAVLAARAVDQRLGYLGDWHSHPDDGPASSTDLQTYRGAWGHALRRAETRPILLVVRRESDGWRIDVTAQQGPWGRSRSVPNVLTGEPEATVAPVR